MNKHEWLILLLVTVLIYQVMVFVWSKQDTTVITKNQVALEQKLDSVLFMQKRIYELDSMYLKTTRIHMEQCGFVLREGILADTNN